MEQRVSPRAEDFRLPDDEHDILGITQSIATHNTNISHRSASPSSSKVIVLPKSSLYGHNKNIGSSVALLSTTTYTSTQRGGRPQASVTTTTTTTTSRIRGRYSASDLDYSRTSDHQQKTWRGGGWPRSSAYQTKAPPPPPPFRGAEFTRQHEYHNNYHHHSSNINNSSNSRRVYTSIGGPMQQQQQQQQQQHYKNKSLEPHTLSTTTTTTMILKSDDDGPPPGFSPVHNTNTNAPMKYPLDCHSPSCTDKNGTAKNPHDDFYKQHKYEDEEGPPPGFINIHSVTNNNNKDASLFNYRAGVMVYNNNEGPSPGFEDEDDGPPPGFDGRYTMIHCSDEINAAMENTTNDVTAGMKQDDIRPDMLLNTNTATPPRRAGGIVIIGGTRETSTLPHKTLMTREINAANAGLLPMMTLMTDTNTNYNKNNAAGVGRNVQENTLQHIELLGMGLPRNKQQHITTQLHQYTIKPPVALLDHDTAKTSNESDIYSMAASDGHISKQQQSQQQQQLLFGSSPPVPLFSPLPSAAPSIW